jgi:hypothetical protein
MADDPFKEFVPDQSGALPELRARAMFGAQPFPNSARLCVLCAYAFHFFPCIARRRVFS